MIDFLWKTVLLQSVAGVFSGLFYVLISLPIWGIGSVFTFLNTVVLMTLEAIEDNETLDIKQG